MAGCTCTQPRQRIRVGDLARATVAPCTRAWPPYRPVFTGCGTWARGIPGRSPPTRSKRAPTASCTHTPFSAITAYRSRPVRSRELWLDVSSTSRAAAPYRPFDLLLVNDTAEAYGAHVGVFVSGDEVLHLCREVGVPTVWRLTDFARRERYATIVGVKRPLPPS